MPKMRGFKPEIWTDDKFVALTPLARLLFMGMWNYACDNGHLDDRPAQLKMRVLPVDNCDVSELLNEITDLGMVTRAGGVITIPKLAVHQRIDKRYFTSCTHCAHDVHTPGTRSAHDVHTRDFAKSRMKEGNEGKEVSEKSDTPPRPELHKLCTHLADRIDENGSKRPTISKAWTDAARLLLDTDKRDPDEAHQLIDWCQNNDFWRPNIMSMGKFRSKYDVLRLQAAKDKPQTNRGQQPEGW